MATLKGVVRRSGLGVIGVLCRAGTGVRRVLGLVLKVGVLLSWLGLKVWMRLWRRYTRPKVLGVIGVPAA